MSNDYNSRFLWIQSTAIVSEMFWRIWQMPTETTLLQLINLITSIMFLACATLCMCFGMWYWRRVWNEQKLTKREQEELERDAAAWRLQEFKRENPITHTGDDKCRY